MGVRQAHSLHVANIMMEEVNIDVVNSDSDESVVVELDADQPAMDQPAMDQPAAVPVNVKKRKRSPPEEPVTEMGRDFIKKMRNFKGNIPDLDKRAVSYYVDGVRVYPDFGDAEAYAMYNASKDSFTRELRVFEKQVNLYIREAGSEARKLRDADTLAARKYDSRIQALSDRRAKKIQEIESQYMHDVELAKDLKRRCVDDFKESRSKIMESELKMIEHEWLHLSKGALHSYTQWLAGRSQKEFLTLFKDGRVLAPDSEVCCACKSSTCVIPGCARPRKFKFGVATKELTDELTKAVSDRKRDVNGAIVLFCASGDSCALTLDKLSPERAALTMPCKHVFDKEAIKRTTKCPTCRAPICILQEYTGDKCAGLLPVNNDD